MNVYLFIAAFSTILFLAQFILSFFIDTDTDADVDVDVEAECFSISDMISFKGLTHFAMGYGWATYIIGSHLIGVITGVCFTFMLYMIYKLTFRLRQDTCTETLEDLDGRYGEVVYRYFKQNQVVIRATLNGRKSDFIAIKTSKRSIGVGDKVRISVIGKSLYV